MQCQHCASPDGATIDFTTRFTASGDGRDPIESAIVRVRCMSCERSTDWIETDKDRAQQPAMDAWMAGTFHV
jgi:hypothetical protein